MHSPLVCEYELTKARRLHYQEVNLYALLVAHKVLFSLR